EDGIRDKLVTGVQTCALPISTVETRMILRDAVDSFGGGRRSLLCSVAARSAAPNAPRSAPSTRSGTLAKVISPSSEAKTAPPIRSEERRVGKGGRCR